MQPIFRTQSRLAVSIGSSAWTGSSRWRWSGRTAVHERAIFGVWGNWSKPCWPYRCPTGRRYVPKKKHHHTRLNAFTHLAFHKRKCRPDAKFLIEVLRSKSFSLPQHLLLSAQLWNATNNIDSKNSIETMTLQKDLHVVFFRFLKRDYTQKCYLTNPGNKQCVGHVKCKAHSNLRLWIQCIPR